MSTKPSGNDDEVPEASPSKLARLLERVYVSHKTERAIADTAKGRRVKAQRDRREEKGNERK